MAGSKIDPRWISLGVVLLAVLVSRPGRSESLDDAWNAAVAANQSLRAAQAGTFSAQHGLAASKAERLPTVTTLNAYTWLNNTPTFKGNLPISGSSAPMNFSMPFLNKDFFFSSTLMTVPLYTGGRILSGIDAAGAQAHAARAEEFTSAMDLKLEVARAYLSVLRVDKLLRLAQSNVTTLAAHERDVQNLYREGVAKRTDLLASRVSLAKARQRVIQTINEAEVARAAYNRLLGRPLPMDTQLQELAIRNDFGLGTKPDLAAADHLPSALGPGHLNGHTDAAQDAEIEQLTATALGARSELVGLSHKAQAYASQARAVEAGKKPQVGFVGGFTYLSDTHLAAQDYWSGSLAATWLLFDGHRANHKAEELRMKECQTLRERNDTASKIALNVRSSWMSLRSSIAALQVAKAAIAQADENLRQTIERYREQVVTNTEVLDAETLRLQTYTDYYNSYYSVLEDQFKLRRAVGVL
ncbi:MAG: TolC family protein [Isosphaeraceae bacterium]